MNRYSDMTIWQLREELVALKAELATRDVTPRAEHEPNAAAQDRSTERASGERTSAGTSPSPAPAAPDVAEMVRLLKAWAHNESTKHPYDSYTGPNKYLIDLLTEAAALLARLRQDTSVLMDSVRRYGATMTNDEILAQIPGASDE